MAQQTIAQIFDLKGKGAIVTGGAMGIGRGIVQRLAEAGAGVIVADINLEAAKKTAEQVTAAGGKAKAMHADAASADDARKTAAAAVEAFGRLDILVNNAGIYPFSPLLDTSEEMWNKVIQINLSGVFFYSQAAAREMVKAGRGGRIVNIASIDAFRPTGRLAHYDASKGGMVSMTKSFALELAPNRILVNAIAPGGVITEGTRPYMTRSMIQAAEGIPLGRYAEPDDIAKVALFLASGASDYMTGSVVLADGGFLLM
ncbi:MAG: SDR family oxidoreductase [Chloroflexi bacterium]|nr:SDR family oxidoreductase [Chloroflexota bacterium]